MDPKTVKKDRKYTKEHEWAKLEQGELQVGITAFAVDQLGDVTLVSLDVAPGDSVKAGDAFGTIESVKTLSDLFAPVSGSVVAINTNLENKPELVNEDCYGTGWMIKIRCDDDTQSEGLLSDDEYTTYVSGLDH
jgi:glycine cleavage system H protein